MGSTATPTQPRPRTNYSAAQSQDAASSTNVTIENISLEQAKRDLAEAEAAYTTAFDPGRDWELNAPRTADALESERDRADDNLLRAQESLQVAQLNFNATVAGTNYSGTVTQVDPTLITSNGVSAVLALVQLDAESFAKLQTLPVGLNATVEIIGGRTENALLVPVEALRDIGDGQYSVEEMTDRMMGE